MTDGSSSHGGLAFALIYFTFFLDNVLLTVLVPIIPDWVRGEALALWAAHDAPLAALLNTTVHRITTEGPGSGGSQAVVGLVLGAKAGAQLLAAPLASALVCRAGPAPVLRAATATLAAAALGAYADVLHTYTAPLAALAAPLASALVCRAGPAPVLRAATATLAAAALGVAGCSSVSGVGRTLCVGAARAAQGAGAALAGVAGLALAAAALPAPQRDRAIGALLGAVALGVLVGYPFGGAANALWSRAAPFMLISVALLADLIMQYMFLDREEFCQPSAGGGTGWGMRSGVAGVAAAGARGACGACAGAVLLTTSVMAALEPCLPLWIMDKFHPQVRRELKWQTGAVFIPDSAGYLAAASLVGGAARRLGAERVALAAQLAVGLAALAVPHATSVSWLALPHLALGLGLGATDAALVPALLARQPARVPHVAALLQAASSVAYTLGMLAVRPRVLCTGTHDVAVIKDLDLGPVAGGLVAWGAGFEATMRALGVLNLLYAALLYRALRRHPLSDQWGASSPDDDSASEEAADEGAPLRPQQYTTLH
ncbi:synaptic vesicular amine transporter-like [Ostrinia nubilalis]|uniref:synaptic vesicular amine transporter-like n=1 Tax=Ostrinia nubilalis TaxID=29057 RepID=UPI0030825155